MAVKEAVVIRIEKKSIILLPATKSVYSVADSLELKTKNSFH